MIDTEPDNTDPARIDAFIARWSKASGSELANYQLFLSELIALLDLPPPDPAGSDQSDNAYVFERRVDIQHADGRTSSGRIDLYRRGCYVCEAKQSGLALRSTAWDGAMMKAHAQASHYARSLPAAEGRPPFILVTDVGRHLGLYADFTRSGANYIPFPDALSHRIYLEDLHRPAIRARLRHVWLDPMALDPTRRSARVTRAISAKLASLARSLEGDGQAPEQVAGFLMRCLFTMFAEDVGLLPARSFSGLLE
ncbi:MAG: class I SAM-dependent DNA methyltransferase, partial [Gammaproteobacteria bacterium]|nr:class I SAM-dependent DNA methyltransferase [Gammaproteobacteria bacterium]